MELSDSVENAPLVGIRYKSLLKRLNIETIEDLLHHYPTRYQDYSNFKKINQLLSGQPVTIQVTVKSIQNIITKRSKRLTVATVCDTGGCLNVIWFNQPFIIKNIKKGNQINLAGSLVSFNNKPALVSPEYEILSTGQSIHTGRLVPIYPETEGFSSKRFRAIISRFLNHESFNNIKDYLSKETTTRFGLIDLRTALKQIHFPQNDQILTRAKMRLSFNELFLLQIKALLKRKEWKNAGPAPKMKRSPSLSKEMQKFIASLPFKLTNAQSRCVNELLEDLEKGEPTNRLLEGDVGSGKTVVSTIGMFLSHLNGYQIVLMAPTEVLANQHFDTVKKLTQSFNLKIGLYTGAKKTTLSKNEKIDIFIGTHALLFDSVKFNNVGFIIIDEQHRFGVAQRAKLIEKAKFKKLCPHLLTMTATPIPRTVALAFYGDLDLSVLDEMPPGRKKVKTYVVPSLKRAAGEAWVKNQIIKHQAKVFVICPLIEESEKLQVKAVTKEYQRLKNEVFANLKVGLLHGQLKQKEKDTVLTQFKYGNLDILVSTSVVEVGIDIPNATIMIIEGADRFGLASLHQLRGRVGRSDKESYCFLFTQSKSKRAFRRLKFMETIHSGFKLSEIDLHLRGPGEIYGLRQHGLRTLKIASLSDIELVEKTRKAAKDILEIDPKLGKHDLLRDKIDSEGKIVPN